MGVPTEIWRARIGSYHPGLHRASFAMAAITLRNKRSGVHLLRAFVMVFIVLPHTTRPQSMFTTDFSALEVGPCSYLGNGQCMGDMTGARIGTALLNQESFCLFLTYSAMSLVLSGGVELNPGPEMCTPDCKHGRHTVGDIIRCCGCATWFHEDCVGIESEEDRGVWPCPECRVTSANIRSLVDTISNLVNLTESISKRLKEVERQSN